MPEESYSSLSTSQPLYDQETIASTEFHADSDQRISNDLTASITNPPSLMFTEVSEDVIEQNHFFAGNFFFNIALLVVLSVQTYFILV